MTTIDRASILKRSPDHWPAAEIRSPTPIPDNSIRTAVARLCAPAGTLRIAVFGPATTVTDSPLSVLKEICPAVAFSAVTSPIAWVAADGAEGVCGQRTAVLNRPQTAKLVSFIDIAFSLNHRICISRPQALSHWGGLN